MQPPQQPPAPSPGSGKEFDFDRDFERLLQEVEQAFQAVQDRYCQVKRDWQRQAELQERFSAIKQEWQETHGPGLQIELKRIQRQLDELEVALESRLLTWLGVREFFWQVIRFGGLGIAIGWFLKSWVG